MRYGTFDDDAREYRIERPDTPTSWSNYLGTTEYGAIVTNNAGGYSFFRSAARGRFLRLRFNSVPMDQPGRFFYLRDADSGDFWSASWQPVGKPLDRYRSVCRHGTAYTILESDYGGIQTETLYFVPLGQRFEYWRLRVRNASERPRSLKVFTYCEFANHWKTEQDLVNLQYSLFIVRARRIRDNLLRVAINEHLPPDPDGDLTKELGMYSWMALVGEPVSGFDCSREAFLGPYRCYDRPLAVERGFCGGSEAYGDNACGSFQADLLLQPGEERELRVLLGVGKAEDEGVRAIDEFGSPERCEQEFLRLKEHWRSMLGSLTVSTPDPEFDSTVNVWGLYNSLVTFAWSRAASLVYNGERDGLGFRDSVQDLLGVMAAIPEQARERLELLLTGQLSTGGAMPVVRPFEHRPGQMPPLPEEEYRSDDCLWFFNAVPLYVAETADLDFYRKVLPYADQGEDTVLGHLRRALEFNLSRTGRNGLPCGLAADWNDCLKLGYHGESLFVAFQVRYGLGVYADAAARLGLESEAEWALREREALDRRIQAVCWDGDRWIWAIGEDGTVYGTRESREGSLYLNTQVWSVLSGVASDEQARTCMDTVRRELFTEHGVMLCAPPFETVPLDVMRAVLFNNGVKENAGIFNHTQGWVVMAECALGLADRAYETYRASMPAAYNDRAEVRQIEPYVQGQTTYSGFSPRAGNCRTPWLTGAAAWAYFSATQAILGIRPELDGLRIDPCIPSSWPGFEATRRFRGCEYRIRVRRTGEPRLVVNGRTMEGNLVPPQSGPSCEVLLEI
ncbi:MAG: hypothetical protein N2109_09420 [Fimbriimonadales bacterium]|nr:hypothetical protein [Fimbriimonadales bacterium]